MGFAADYVSLHPVNSGRSFTGKSGSFAEYRVRACRISRRLALTDDIDTRLTYGDSHEEPD